MKILAIRGAGLASLADPFEIDFETGPLGRACLFAITGPTGAGKTTLLDAMCLALFDEVPRLEGAGKAPVGRADEKSRLGVDDVRALVRKGAAEGWAEVDFLGRDGRRYRARWHAWRARKRADGAFQAQEMTLLDLESGKRLGDGKADTCHRIEDRLGLSFDQFCRSVLLAQGQFSKFLAAKADERAELLEKITGTDIYARVSIAAHERAGVERKRLEGIEAQLAGLRVLEPAERAARTEEAAHHGDAAAAAERRRAEAQRSVDSHAALAALRQQEAAADRRVEESRRAVEALAEREMELLEIAAVQPLREPMRAADDAAAREAEAAERLRQTTAHEGEARNALEGCTDSERAAREAFAEAYQAAQSAKPALAEARALDARIAGASTDARRAEEEDRSAGVAAAEARKAADRARRDRDEAQKLRDSAQAWLDERPGLAPLAKEGVDGLLRRASDLTRRAAEARTRASDAAGRTAAATARAEEAQKEAGAAGHASAAERASAQAAARAAEAAPPEAAGRKVEGLQRLAAVLETLRDHAVAAARHAEREGVESAAAARADAEARAAGETARAQELEEAAARAAHDEAARALRAIEAALSLVARRAELADDAPCPLCGAREHPYARENPPGDEALRAQRERARSLDRHAQEAAVAAAGARVLAQQREAQGREARERAAREAEARREREERWATTIATGDLSDASALPAPSAGPTASGAAPALLPLAAGPTASGAAPALLPLPAGPAAPGAAAALAGRSADVRDRLETARARFAEARRLAQTAHDAAEKERSAHAALAERLARVPAAQAEAAGGAGEEQRARAQADEAERSLREVRADLATACAGVPRWQERLAEDAEGFRRECARLVEGWKARRAELDDAVERASVLAVQEREREGQAIQREGERAARAEERARRDEAFAGLRRERAGRFDGRAADEAERELEQARRRTEAARDQARDGREAAARRCEAAAREQIAAAAERTRTQEQHAECERELENRLRVGEQNRARVRELLGRDLSWIQAQERELKECKELKARALEVRAERTRARKAQESAAPPAHPDAPAAVAALATARVDFEESQRAQVAAQFALDQDDGARAAAAGLAPDLDAQRRRCRRWDALKDLIGSSDGKTFRVFAQGVTLEALVDHANRHLRELARRYRLERVPGADMELQVVDQDMGDAVRGASSLSGGETFLVSLGLALALSSIAADRTPVGSLFVDEGFGSLDPASLEIALGALDGLQAAGRKVGVISHVSGFAERVGVRIEVVPVGAGESRVEVRES